MKISELIKVLEKVKVEHGDIEVTVSSNCGEPTSSITETVFENDGEFRLPLEEGEKFIWL